LSAVMERTMSTNDRGVRRALTMAAELLRPKLRRLLLPAVFDCTINIRVIIQDGALNHVRDNEIEPAYVSHLTARLPDDADVDAVMLSAIETLKTRLVSRMVPGWHGYVVLHIAIAHGEATITSEVDGSHRP
jgi:hypothetical protein